MIARIIPLNFLFARKKIEMSSREERIQWNYSCAIRISHKQFHAKNFATVELGAVHMSRASPANRADLNHENLYFSTT